MIRGWVYSTKF